MLEASDIAEAAHACREVSEPVDLAIIDIKSGMQLAGRLAQRYPHMGLLFVGDSEEMGVHPPPRLKCRYLRKPFTAETLLRSVRGLIQAGVAA